jgi:hypothetical protein
MGDSNESGTPSSYATCGAHRRRSASQHIRLFTPARRSAVDRYHSVSSDPRRRLVRWRDVAAGSHFSMDCSAFSCRKPCMTLFSAMSESRPSPHFAALQNLVAIEALRTSIKPHQSRSIMSTRARLSSFRTPRSGCPESIIAVGASASQAVVMDSGLGPSGRPGMTAPKTFLANCG